MDFSFYNLIFIRGFTCMLTVVCADIIMLWVLPNESKKFPIRIIGFILTTPKNKQHSCKNIRVDDYGALEDSTYVTNLLVEEFKYPWKLLVVMHIASMKIMKDIT